MTLIELLFTLVQEGYSTKKSYVPGSKTNEYSPSAFVLVDITFLAFFSITLISALGQRDPSIVVTRPDIPLGCFCANEISGKLIVVNAAMIRKTILTGFIFFSVVL